MVGPGGSAAPWGRGARGDTSSHCTLEVSEGLLYRQWRAGPVIGFPDCPLQHSRDLLSFSFGPFIL